MRSEGQRRVQRRWYARPLVIVPAALVALGAFGFALLVRGGYLPRPAADERHDAAVVDEPLVEKREAYIERLANPVALKGWDEKGLILESGRLPLPDVKRLPRQSDALAEAVRGGGVEIDARGRVFGLLRIHHWCGNDPVGRHVARVDLSLLVRYEGEGHGWRFSENGWDVSEFSIFRWWATDPVGFTKPSDEPSCSDEVDAGR